MSGPLPDDQTLFCDQGGKLPMD